MLTPVAPGPAVIVCSSCRGSETANGEGEGERAGARLAHILRAAQAADSRYAALAVQDMPCFFACSDGCAVHLRAPGKISYVLGRFGADQEAAAAILDYALQYASSVDGLVPYRDWPDGVKGHFLTRSPPEGYLAS